MTPSLAHDTHRQPVIFLQYRCDQAQKHITYPEVQVNIQHFLK